MPFPWGNHHLKETVHLLIAANYDSDFEECLITRTWVDCDSPTDVAYSRPDQWRLSDVEGGCFCQSVYVYIASDSPREKLAMAFQKVLEAYIQVADVWELPPYTEDGSAMDIRQNYPYNPDLPGEFWGTYGPGAGLTWNHPIRAGLSGWRGTPADIDFEVSTEWERSGLLKSSPLVERGPPWIASAEVRTRFYFDQLPMPIEHRTSPTPPSGYECNVINSIQMAKERVIELEYED